MPPAARNSFVILFDMKTKSRAKALNALSKILLYKKLSQAKDQYKLYLINAGQSTNNTPGMYPFDINVDVNTVLDEIQAIETGESNWLEVLEVAVNDLKEWYEEAGIITLQVLFITDLSSFECPEDKLVKKTLINDLESYDMFLYVVGPDIEPPKIILSKAEIREWMESLTVDSANLRMMKDIVVSTPHSVICSYEIGVHLFNSFQYRKGMQPWQVPLTFGTSLSLAASTIRITKRDAPFKLKSTVGRSNYDMKWVYADQEDVELHFADTIGGLVRHGKFVKIETDNQFKIESPRTLSVLGFTSAEFVPEYLLKSDGSYVVLPDQKQSAEDLAFFSTFVAELEKSEKYIIARRVYNKNYTPKFVALIPRSGLNCFIMCELPYADDIAHKYVEKDTETAPRGKKNEDIYNFLNNLDVTGKNCQVRVPLAPAMMVDPNCLNIIKKVEEKTMEDKILEQKFSLFDVENVKMDNLKNVWPVRELLKPKKEEMETDDQDDLGDFNFD